MNMTIHAIQALKLMFSVDVVNFDNARLLHRVSHILQQIVDAPCSQSIGDFEQMLLHPDSAILHNNMCTWRPTFCLDIALILEKDRGISVGLPLYAPPGHTPSAEIKFFQSESYNKVAVEDCVCFGHLTCDTDDDCVSSLVILVYDVLLRATDMPLTTQRYAHLREIELALNQIVLGGACVRVQWAGDCKAFDKIQTISLPHAHDTIIVYGNDYQYNKFKMIPPHTKPSLHHAPLLLTCPRSASVSPPQITSEHRPSIAGASHKHLTDPRRPGCVNTSDRAQTRPNTDA